MPLSNPPERYIFGRAGSLVVNNTDVYQDFIRGVVPAGYYKVELFILGSREAASAQASKAQINNFGGTGWTVSYPTGAITAWGSMVFTLGDTPLTAALWVLGSVYHAGGAFVVQVAQNVAEAKNHTFAEGSYIEMVGPLRRLPT